jgi:MFS family permease
LPRVFSALEVRDFRLLWTGAFLSGIGTWTQDVALAWLIHTRFGNPVYLGLRSFAQEAPLIAFMLIGGAFADRVDRRRILLGSQLLQMGFAIALAVLHAADLLGLSAILLIAFLTGLAQSQSAPTYQAVLTTLVPQQRIPNAVALNSLQFNLARFLGPAVAGLLLARAGTTACFGANALSFVAVIVALLQLRMPPAAPASGSLRDSLVAGFRHVGGSPALRPLTALAAVASVLAFPLITYLPVIAGDELGTGAAGYSLLLSSYGAGAIGGALTTAQRGNRPGRGRLMLAAWVLFGSSTILTVASRTQGLSMALIFVSGWCQVTAFSTLNSLVQEHTPGELRGRVLAIYGLAFRGGMPLGSLVAGLFVARFGAPWVIGSFCFLLAAIAVVLRARGARVSRL